MRPSTWLVTAGVLAVGIAGMVDALPRGRERAGAPPSGEALPAASTATLRSSRLGGVLYYTDDGCRLRAVRLPSLRPAEAPPWRGCRFSLGPYGPPAAPEQEVWHPRGHMLATERAGFVALSFRGAPFRGRIAGAAPAFKPNGVLTYVRDGKILALTGRCRPGLESVTWLGVRSKRICGQILLTKRDLARDLRFDSNVARSRGPIDSFRVEEIGWLGDTRLVAILALELRSGGREDLVAVYDGRRLLRTVPAPGGRFSGLEVSPGGTFAAARTTAPSGFVLVDRRARPFSLPEVPGDRSGHPPFTRGRSIAWAPGERFAAIASRSGIRVFSLTARWPALVRLPLAARDLAWRSEPVRVPSPDHRSR